MLVTDPQALRQKFAGLQIKIDSFFLRKTDLQANQTLLKLGEYNLNCIPAYLTFDDAQLLAVLTPSEVSLFSKYSSATNTLVMSFGNKDTTDVSRFHIRVNLTSINSLGDRKNVCLLAVKFKAAPAELVQILGGFLEELEDKKVAYEKYAQSFVELTPEASTIMGYNNYAEIVDDKTVVKVKLKAFHSKIAQIVLPEKYAVTEFLSKKPLFLKLYFRSSQFTVEGHFTENGEFHLEFSNELITVLDDYNFRTTMLAKKRSEKDA